MRLRPGISVQWIAYAHSVIAGIDNHVAVIVRIHAPGIAELAIIIQALESLRGQTRFGHAWHKYTEQEAKGCDNYKQLKQAKSNSFFENVRYGCFAAC
jgi:hypothetical protein